MNDHNNLGLTIRYRGVRGSIPSPGRETARYGGNTSCVELRCDGHLLILDAGSGIRSLGNDLLLEFGDKAIQADVLVSHAHWDHIQGFPFFAPAYAHGNCIRVLHNSVVASGVASGLRSQMESLHFPVALDRMHGLVAIEEIDYAPVEMGAFTIRSIALNHPGGCAGFRIESKYGTVAYLPDHEPFPKSASNGHAQTTGNKRRAELIEFLHGADLLILDTQYTEEEYARRVGWGHGCLPHSVALAVNANVAELALFHHDPCHRDYQIDLMVESARELVRAGNLKISAAAETATVFLLSHGQQPSLPPNGQTDPMLRCLAGQPKTTSVSSLSSEPLPKSA